MSEVAGLEATGGAYKLDNWAGSVPKDGGTLGGKVDGGFADGIGTLGAI